MKMTVWEVSHPSMSHPLVLEDPTGRKSEEVIKWTAVQFLETNYRDFGYDWVEEMDNFTIGCTVEDAEQ